MLLATVTADRSHHTHTASVLACTANATGTGTGTSAAAATVVGGGGGGGCFVYAVAAIEARLACGACLLSPVRLLVTTAGDCQGKHGAPP